MQGNFLFIFLMPNLARKCYNNLTVINKYMAKTEKLVAMNVRIPISLHEKINQLVETEERMKQIVVARLLEKAIAEYGHNL